MQYYIGLMSGTSLDGIDIALVSIDGNDNISLTDFSCIPLTDVLRDTLTVLSNDKLIDIELMAKTGVEVAELCANGINNMLESNALSSSDIVAIGSHGITVRHKPDIDLPFSLQITDANRLAALTNIDVIADFRGMDIAYGGQGAPLVPTFHKALLDQGQQGIFLNLGGIANITVVANDSPLLGYDTGPANTLMNNWCLRHLGQDFDQDGKLAASGTCSQLLLNKMLQEDYFSMPYPKSTGKETFNLEWLDSCIASLSCDLSIADVQASLLQLTAQTVADQINQFDVENVFVCGGGGANPVLMQALQQQMPNKRLRLTNDIGVDSDALEAMAFAWFAFCRVNHIPATAPSVTGASQASVLGAWYKAN